MNQSAVIPNPRVSAIFERVIEKLKEVVREFEITQDELHAAGDYFNRLGQSGFCRSLIDVGLAMTSVDVTARVENGTRPNLEGPFHRMDNPVRPDGNLFDTAPPPGSPVVTLTGRILDAATGAPIKGAVLDVWQADHEGHYDRTERHLSGQIPVDADGSYRVFTAVPKDYSDHDHDPIGELYRLMGRHNRRAAHIHCKVWVGDACVLTTQLFIPGNEYLDSDYVEGAVSSDLLLDMRPVEGTPNAYKARFDFQVALPAQLKAAQ